MNSFCPECRRTYDRGVGVCPHDDTDLVPTEERDDPLLGTVFEERYRLDEMLGSGGMGVVYRANQLAVDRDVAVKILRSEVAHLEEAHQRFSREAKLISSLSHPNIVKLIDFGRDPDEGAWFLVMEYVGGRELGDLLDDGPLDVEVALEVVYQSCAALAASHASGMIHRDLKPENLHLQAVPDGTLQVKVLDFGIARCVEKTTRLTESDMICGTPGYMAPEQARGFDVDPRADIYALGVILYEMLTGKRPFDADEAIQLLVKHLTEEPEPLETFLPSDVPGEDLEELVSDMMAKSPADRPDDAATVRRRIEAIREEMGQPLHQLPGHYGSDEALDDVVRPVDRGATEQEYSYPPDAGRNPLATTAGTFHALEPDTDEFELESTAQLQPDGTEEAWPADKGDRAPVDPSAKTVPKREHAAETVDSGSAEDYAAPNTDPSGARNAGSAPASPSSERELPSRAATDPSALPPERESPEGAATDPSPSPGHGAPPDSGPSTDPRESSRPESTVRDSGNYETLLRVALTLLLGSALLALAVVWLRSGEDDVSSDSEVPTASADASSGPPAATATGPVDDATGDDATTDTSRQGDATGRRVGEETGSAEESRRDETATSDETETADGAGPRESATTDGDPTAPPRGGGREADDESRSRGAARRPEPSSSGAPDPSRPESSETTSDGEERAGTRDASSTPDTGSPSGGSDTGASRTESQTVEPSGDREPRDEGESFEEMLESGELREEN